MRVGLFGGSFNPIHLGHLRAAEEVREALQLDLVYFIPAASPPHKAEGELAPAEHRLAMVRAATKGNRHFMTSDVEVRRAGRSYTIETVHYFLATLRQPATLYLMMGADQFAELESWKARAAVLFDPIIFAEAIKSLVLKCRNEVRSYSVNATDARNKATPHATKTMP